MNSIKIEQLPIATMAYFRVRKGIKGRERAEWPFYTVYVDCLPKGLQARGVDPKRVGVLLAGDLHADPTSFVICGHRHWPGNRVETLRNGTRVMNVACVPVRPFR